MQVDCAVFVKVSLIKFHLKLSDNIHQKYLSFLGNKFSSEFLFLLHKKRKDENTCVNAQFIFIAVLFTKTKNYGNYLSQKQPLLLQNR